ncbi:MAG: PD-(D/E)XK nuclease family protein [Clostridia bacterium]|nr:PD-(D/E)XK nuclease family protein [Clostridia bacterium]
MSATVKFILGRSGSGKTRAVFDAIIEREKRDERSFLIVPDRAAFETERALSEAVGEANGSTGGMMHTTACSFTRIAHRVLAETGNSRAYLSSEGRLMLLRRILDENKSALVSFGRVCTHRGFAEECDEIILKCKRFSIEPSELSSAEVPERLRNKLADFALLYEKLTERMRDRYIDGEDLVNSLIERIPLSSLRGAAVFIDAPDMLNAQSLRIIEKLFYTAEGVTVTFRADIACREANGGLFLPDIGYYERLAALANEAGCRVETLQLMGNKRHASPALCHLEATLFSPAPAAFSGDAREIELHSSQDRYSEVREAASEILRAVRGGMRFRDIAVAVTDLASYGEPIRRVFGAANIPVFMDAKRRVASHPVSELILAALRCIERGFLGEDFIRILKTGLTDFPDTTLEKLENHILKFALMGKRLTSSEPSVKNAEEIRDFEEIERARIAIAEPLLALKERLGEDGSRAATTRVFALYSYLEEMRVAERLKDSFESLKMNAETLAFALENRQIYDTIIELLDQICVIIGDEPIGLARFSAVVKEGLEAYEVGLIPTTLDQVLVGDVSSIHPTEVRFLLVLGANEGRFPSGRTDNSIINDRELEAMRSAGLKVWESTASMDAAERLRVYSLICRAKQRLYLSYCRDDRSENSAPSALIRRIGEAFPHCRRSGGTLSPSTAESDEAAFAALAEGLRRFIDTGEEDGVLAKLYAHFYADEKYAMTLRALTKAYYRADALAPLGREKALELYGNSMTGSVSRLETFNKCPYRHLLQYGLSLREREEHGIRNNEFGTLIHDALDKLVRSYIDLMRADPQKCEEALANLTKQDVEDRLDALLPEIIEGFNHGILLESATMRARLESIKRRLRDAGYAVLRQIAGGKFRPYATELRFGGRDDELPALEIESSGGTVFKIRGVIDRIDILSGKTAEDANGKPEGYFRIVDYKTYSSPFNFTDLVNGLKVQLPLYALAVRAALDAEGSMDAAGMYYLHIHAPAVDEEEKRDEIVLKKLKLSGPTLNENGVILASDPEISPKASRFISGLRRTDDGFAGKLLVTSEEMDKTLDFARESAKKTLDAIMEGRSEVSPYRHGGVRACKSCPYGSVCGFDTTAGDRYRRISSAAPEKFFGRKE